MFHFFSKKPSKKGEDTIPFDQYLRMLKAIFDIRNTVAQFLDEEAGVGSAGVGSGIIKELENSLKIGDRAIDKLEEEKGTIEDKFFRV